MDQVKAVRAARKVGQHQFTTSIVHPFLLAIFPVLFLYAKNISRLQLAEIYRSTLVSLLAAVVLLVLFRLVIWNWLRAALLTSLVLILFSSYGNVYTSLHYSSLSSSPFARADVLAAIWASVFIIAGWLIIRKIKDLISFTQYFNLVSLFLIISQLVSITGYVYRNRNSLFPPNSSRQAALAPIAAPETGLPDIYYIILDEYGRQDVLQKYYDYDNSDLVGFLQDQGFYVAADSHSNYPITFLSLCSSLNLNYVEALFDDDTFKKSGNSYQIIDKIHHSKLREYLSAQGYRFITFSTMYSFTDIKDADVYITPPGSLTDFEVTLLENSAYAIAAGPTFDQQYRDLILNDFSHLKSLPLEESQQPRFIFVHMLATHVPFVFGPDGESVPGWYYFPHSNNRTYVQAYRDQLTYVNSQLEESVDAILKTSKRKPIIIIQSDHGPQSKLNWYSIEDTALDERFGILNAYYLPDQHQDELYTSITPVNSFRVILNAYFGTDMPLLEDRSYFVGAGDPMPLTDVTARLK